MKKHTTTVGPTGMRRLRSLLAFRHHNPVARLISIVAAFAIATLLVGVNVAPVQAASPCPIPGGFEIDGDMTLHTCTPQGDDWGAHTLTPTGDVDMTTQGGTYSTAGKDDADPSTWVSSGSTPDKTDFERAYATSKTVDIGGGVLHYFVFVAWERTSTSGTQGYAIEIDNAAANTAPDGTPQPNRSNGTAVVYVSSQGSSAPTFDEACTFTSQSDYGDTCTSSNAYVTLAINTASMSDPLAGTTQAAGSFFEVALDVTGLTGIAPSCPGASANSVYLRSITGQTHNGNLKGYLAPLEVAPDSTCATPTITTQTQQNDQIDGLDVVAPGTPQHDVATVTGTAAHPAPTGSVTFSLCGPTGSATDCTTGGQSGGTHALVQHASNSTAQSSDVAPEQPGWYCWRAAFTPDPVNSNNPFLPATATDKTNECFKVAYATPSIATVSSFDTEVGAAPHSVGFTTLGDTATLSNVYSGADLSGQKVTFSLYGPLGSTPNAEDCTGDPRVFGPEDASLTKVDDTTWQAVAPTYTPSASDGPGTYTWIASYAGDEINAGDTGACDDANETQELVGPLLTLSKGTPNATITAGEDIVYDIDLENVGEGTASGVVVTDVLPILKGGGTWTLDATSGYNCSIADGTGGNAGHQVVTCDVGDLDPLDKTQIAEVSAPTVPADCGDITNSALLEADPDVSEKTADIKVHVQCPGLDIVKEADADRVDVGSPIGFTITASNNGEGTATGVLVSDPLPTGPGITWTLDAVGTTGPLDCVIDSGTLECTGTLDAGETQVVHVTSPTQWTGSGETEVNSCRGGTEGTGVYDNTAQVSAGNVTDSPTSSAHEQVLCPALALAKTADAATVNAGGQVGFTVTASNPVGSGVGTAHGVVIDDPLPAGSGIDWSIASGPQNCSIQGSPPAETLHCTAVDLVPGGSESVHVVSGTGATSCSVYPNLATLVSSNAPGLSAGAQTQVANCLIVSPPQAPQVSPPAALPNTGGPDGWVLAAGLVLLLGGSSLVVGDRRRRRRS